MQTAQPEIRFEVLTAAVMKRSVFWDIHKGPVSLCLFLFPTFLFAAQPKEFFFDALKKLEQRSHKYMALKGGIGRVNTWYVLDRSG
jgi:hypothetical protein